MKYPRAVRVAAKAVVEHTIAGQFLVGLAMVGSIAVVLSSVVMIGQLVIGGRSYWEIPVFALVFTVLSFLLLVFELEQVCGLIVDQVRQTGGYFRFTNGEGYIRICNCPLCRVRWAALGVDSSRFAQTGEAHDSEE